MSSLAWRDLTVNLNTKKEKRTLLDRAAGTAYIGRVLAIIGPSGAGKTTLLQTLGGRLEASSKVKLSGSLEPSFDRPAAFIYQDDAFHGRLTVEETLRFAAALRLPADEIDACVANVLLDYGLSDVAGTVVGGAKTRGISGGERKRLAIGSALLAADGLAPIFADEPTSGLDSFQAQRVAESLRTSCLNRGNGRMVVLTVHQPSAHLLGSFDEVCLLGTGGRTLYYGSKSDMLNELGRLTGLKRPIELSPAEWALEIASVDPDDVYNSKRRIKALAARWRQEGIAELHENLLHHTAARLQQSSLASGQNMKGTIGSNSTRALGGRSSWLVQLRWCLWRSMKQAVASPALLLMRIFGATMMPALCFGCIWWKLPLHKSSVKARVGLLQVLCNFVGVTAAMKSVRTLQEGEFVAVRRERAAGALRLSPYFLGKVLAELPVSLLLPCVLVAIVHSMANLAGSLSSFCLLMALETLAASALGTLAGAAAPTLDVGLEGTKALTTLSTVFGGMYFDASTLPWVIRWLPRTSIIRVTWDGLLECEVWKLAKAAVVPSAVALLAEHGVESGSTSAPRGRRGLVEETEPVQLGRTATFELLRISVVLLVAAYMALAAKAPRFHALKAKRD